jgi:hypothetical protein
LNLKTKYDKILYINITFRPMANEREKLEKKIIKILHSLKDDELL